MARSARSARTRRPGPPRALAAWALVGLAACWAWRPWAAGACWSWAPPARAEGGPAVQAGGRRGALLAAAAGAAGLGGGRRALAETASTPEGLQYEILKEGSGDPVVEGEQVQVYYNVWLRGFDPPGKFSPVNLAMINANKGPVMIQTSRTDFDVNGRIVVNQRPIQFAAGTGGGAAVRGFGLGVLGMRVGETRRITIPPELGYGGNANPLVPANSTLYVEFELHDKGMPPPGPNEQWFGQGKTLKKKKKKKKAPPAPAPEEAPPTQEQPPAQ